MPSLYRLNRIKSEFIALQRNKSILPAQGIIAALLYLLVLNGLAIWQSLEAPWLGLTLKSQSGQLIATETRGPSSAIIDNSIIEAIATGAGSDWLELDGVDIMEEPDLLPGYPELDAFFKRQGEIAAILKSPTVAVLWRNTETNERLTTVVLPADRPLSSLPTLFWFQVFICSLGCLIAIWVWVLQPTEPGARMFGITGLLFPVFVLPASIYSGRELALDENLFFALSAANHLGSKMFGSAFVGIFMLHPARLLPARWLYGLFILMFFWWTVNAGRLIDSMDIGLRAAIFLLLALSFCFGFMQWRKSKNNPLQRASLRWLVLSLLVGTSLYIFLFTASASLGWITAIPQGYAFGFFLLIYIGIALGIGRYRLFDLDVWAYRLLLWIAATLAVVLLDAALIVLLDWSQGLALGVSLWICGVLYFPVRQWLWEKLVSRNAPELSNLLPELLTIAFSSTAQQRASQWQQLLNQIYSPLKIQWTNQSGTHTRLLDAGTGLEIPACASMPALELKYRAQGKQLFSSADVKFIDALSSLMNRAEAARVSKEEGAVEERRRITRDIHDDVGARLLMLIHSSENPKQAELARSAIEDLRSALANIDGEPVLLEEAVADWRSEANERCDMAKVTLNWVDNLGDTNPLLEPRLKTLLQRALRELITNAIKHGKPDLLSVQFGSNSNLLSITITHNGAQLEPSQWVPGIGIKGLLDRLKSCGGTMHAELDAQGNTVVLVHAPLVQVEQ